MKRTITLLAAVAAMASGPSTVSAKDTSHIENVVLVHGAAVDGSSWRKVYDILVRKHYTVSVVQLPCRVWTLISRPPAPS
ncbi:lipase family protein [Novosphingobium panipatense]|uniref:hypothetical protein n=1 Tax=Novosphingobium panipatense TaxID=428991 RepID=UPI003615B652